MGPELFYPYQQRWIAAESRFKAGMFARQTGKTFCTTFEIARDCQLADLEGRRERQAIFQDIKGNLGVNFPGLSNID